MIHRISLSPDCLREDSIVAQWCHIMLMVATSLKIKKEKTVSELYTSTPLISVINTAGISLLLS